ncbi:porin family protein [Chitinophaga sp. HK235]|uniref:porin family protein n=1 Tax=Chitinophaga sp. HK235 TaxID=2952571 RepID=UPI001BAC6402|nr:porin family protein [Chitinophaga sp. HK235]
MQKNVLLFAPLLLFFQSALAQFEVGVTGGYVNNYLHTSAGYRAFTQYHQRSGFMAGLVLQYHFNNWLAVQIEPSYIQKNYEQRRDHFFDGIYQINSNGYLQLPLMAHFSFGGEKLKGFVNTGGYAARWVTARVKGAMGNVFDNSPDIPPNQQPSGYFQYNLLYQYDQKYTFDSRRDRRMEWGLVAGGGVEYLLQESCRLFVEARYYYGLSDQQKNYMLDQVPRYNDTYVIQAGCLLNLGSLFGGYAE